VVIMATCAMERNVLVIFMDNLLSLHKERFSGRF